MKTFGDVTFSYDVQGNLISIYKNQGNPAAQLGERYTYDLNNKAGKQELYLPSTLAVGLYLVSVNVGIAEMMMWLPTQSPYRRIKREFGSPDYIMTHDDYSNHTYSNGKLVAFSHGAPTTIRNSWKCN